MNGSEKLDRLAQQAAACRECGLGFTRTQAVFGVGSSTARVMFVGEAPGYYEDQAGEPFVGRAGQLLDRLLEEIQLSRPEVYIANVLKCRPPGNRDPLPEEIQACKHFLLAQLEEVNPEVVSTMGNFATKLLLKTTTGITRMRGQKIPWWRKMVVIPTFHPAAALRQGERFLEDMRTDFRLIRDTLDNPDSFPALKNFVQPEPGNSIQEELIPQPDKQSPTELFG